jgi:apolipoprotein N-acyltransferase
MLPPSQSPPENSPPLVVDLDGTLLKTDLLWECLARRLRRNPFSIFWILFWWMRGRAVLKRKLAERVSLDPAALPYHEPFLAWLRAQKTAGRKIILATASDQQVARPVAGFVGIFDEVLASDGRINLRGANKLKVLTACFGERGFDYAGNSAADYAVWRGARRAIVVNAPHAVAQRATALAGTGEMFLENYSPLQIPRRFLSELFWCSGWLTALAAGLLLAAAFPNFAGWKLAGAAWMAPALLMFAAQNKSGGERFWIGYGAGLAFWLVSLYWLLLMPAPVFNVLGWLALSAYLALFPAVWTGLTGDLDDAKFHRPSSWSGRLAWSLSGAAIWVALEMLRARLLGGFPWNFMAVSQFEMTPLIQFASVTGVYGISFLIVWTSLSLFSAVKMIFRKPAARFLWLAEIVPPFIAVAAVFGWGQIKLAERTPAASTLRVTLIQPSIPQTLIWDERANSNRFQQLLELSEAALAQRPDLLLWPESAVPELNETTYTAITNLVCRHHLWLIFNADDVVPRPPATNELDNDVFNAAFLLDPAGHFAGVYHKQQLVIFGEYIPLARWLPFLKWLTPITGSFAAGNAPAQFHIGAIQAAPLICFEDTFPSLARAAARRDTDFLVNLTNDGWFGDSAEQWQHMANALFRTVENRLPLVRCCNNGVTCWVDASGRVRKILRNSTGSIYGVGAMTIELPLSPHQPTFYNRHGDWFGWSCVGATALFLAERIWRRRRRHVVQG